MADRYITLSATAAAAVCAVLDAALGYPKPPDRIIGRLPRGVVVPKTYYPGAFGWSVRATFPVPGKTSSLLPLNNEHVAAIAASSLAPAVKAAAAAAPTKPPPTWEPLTEAVEQ